MGTQGVMFDYDNLKSKAELLGLTIRHPGQYYTMGWLEVTDDSATPIFHSLFRTASVPTIRGVLEGLVFLLLYKLRLRAADKFYTDNKDEYIRRLLQTGYNLDEPNRSDKTILGLSGRKMKYLSLPCKGFLADRLERTISSMPEKSVPIYVNVPGIGLKLVSGAAMALNSSVAPHDGCLVIELAKKQFSPNKEFV